MSAAVCGRDRAELGATLWDTGAAAPDLCRECSAVMLAATERALETTAQVLSQRRVATETEEERDRTHDTAKEALRALARVVPADVTADLVVYARACLVRGDPGDAHASLRTWLADMRAIGVLAVE